MEEQEFRRVLNLFPVVRSRDYIMEEESSRRSTSQSRQDDEAREWQDAWGDGEPKGSESGGPSEPAAFWEKLKLAVQKKVGKSEADRFCSTFRQLHQKLVFEELNLHAAQNYLNYRNSRQ
ncbi:hypothetical protein SAY87_025550 [Trapa incisa]|uniref:Uncharacterized protein n=2 Tax=Trapa TaxID=22665 RepID=A0AAN7R5G1_TRANT|nr:hypothetical protein SAY87_025550 [Trapa incisa]KAK4787996.1 hypothetical protein SAY86_019315 [Trapa natans]